MKITRIANDPADFGILHDLFKANYIDLIEIFSYYASLGTDFFEESLHYLQQKEFYEFLKHAAIKGGLNEIKQELDILFIASYYQPTSNNTNGNIIE